MKSVSHPPLATLIAGAGPAGATAARGLALRGHRVTLLDAARFPRSKVCGCCLNARAIRALEASGLTIDFGIPLHGVELLAGKARATFPITGTRAVSRERLDAFLVREAVAAGANLREDTRLISHCSVPVGREAFLRTQGSEFLDQTRLLLDATGLGAGKDRRIAPGSRMGAGAQLPGDRGDIVPGVIRMHVGRGGYVGMVCIEEGYIDIAAALDPAFVRESGGLAAAAASILRECGARCDALLDIPWRGTPLLTQSARQPAGPGFLRIGDAAGYIEPFTGEGMAWAVASGLDVVHYAESILAGESSAIERWTGRTRGAHRGRIGCRVISATLRRPRLTSGLIAALGMVPSALRPVLMNLGQEVPTP